MLLRSTGKKINGLQVYNSFLDLLQNSGARPIFVKLPPPFMFPHFLPVYGGQRVLPSTLSSAAIDESRNKVAFDELLCRSSKETQDFDINSFTNAFAGMQN
ncbi:hypothetical protein TNCV_2328231 [Trichonephila clavipes]|nr:hypothetical protein TNCV_2328231 [Trichonephila clavipes]